MQVRYRLARVLGVRTQLRKLVQDEVALLGARLAGLHEREAVARRAQEEAHAAVEAATRAGVTGEELVRWGRYEATLAARAAALALESAQVAETIVCRREELLERRRDERKLELLRERAETHQQAAEAQAEAVVIDDAALRQRRWGGER